jgi:hypothetical protein
VVWLSEWCRPHAPGIYRFPARMTRVSAPPAAHFLKKSSLERNPPRYKYCCPLSAPSVGRFLREVITYGRSCDYRGSLHRSVAARLGNTHSFLLAIGGVETLTRIKLQDARLKKPESIPRTNLAANGDSSRVLRLRFVLQHTPVNGHCQFDCFFWCHLLSRDSC